MAQAASQSAAVTGFHNRAMTPVQNPVYVHNDDDTFKQPHPMAANVLERPAGPKGVDPRLTSQGSLPPVSGLTPIVPFAGQTPYNVWQLMPA